MWLYVAVGGAAGALGRYWISAWIRAAFDGAFPLGTFIVNIVGSFLIGFGLQAMEILLVSASMRTMLAVGFLGAFTTFSTFSFETVTLLRDGDWIRAVMYAGLSVGLGLVAVIAGLAAASILVETRG